MIANINSAVALTIGAASVAASGLLGTMLLIEQHETARLTLQMITLMQELADEKERNRALSEFMEGSRGINGGNADCVLLEFASPGVSADAARERSDCQHLPGLSGRQTGPR